MNSLPSKAFEDAGFYVMRSERLYLLAACQPIGVNRNGPHKHNDWLSFELCVDDQPVIIDPGTYCYTGNMVQRRLFRSTAYHNTVVVDGQEQVDIWNSMFGLVNPYGAIRVLHWESNAGQDLLEAEHTGYTRLASPVIHRRRFRLDKVNQRVEIVDKFLGRGERLLEWHLHLDQGMRCRVTGPKAIVSQNQTPILEVEFDAAAGSPEVKTGWVSKSYNQREEAEIIYWGCQNELSMETSLVLQLTPLWELSKITRFSALT
jgi:hypothetical protein